MEHRKGYKNYLINGFKQAGSKLYNFIWRVDVRWSLTIAIAALGIILHDVWTAVVGGVVYALAPFILKKDGLTADNLQLVLDLEKRMADLPEYIQKNVVEGIMNQELEKRFKTFEKLTPDAIEKLLDFTGDDKDKGIRSKVTALAEELRSFKEEAAKKPKDMGFRAQMNSWVTENKATLDLAFRDGKLVNKEALRGLKPLEIRAAVDMTPANTFNPGAAAAQSLLSPYPQFEAGFNEIVRVQPTFWDYLRKGRSSSFTYVWTNKKKDANTGAADFLAPGAAKPKASFYFKTEYSQAKKVAVYDRMAMETLQDMDGMQSYVQQELVYQVKQQANTVCLATGDTGADADTPNSIKKLSVAFTAAGLSTANPNNWDVGRAVAAQIRANNLEGAITIFVNPIDKANMDMTKAASQGQLYAPGPQAVTWVEDNNIPVGSFQAAILDRYRILMYQDLVVEFGLNGDDFKENMLSARAEMRFHQVFSENYSGAFVFDTFDNVKAAIAAV